MGGDVRDAGRQTRAIESEAEAKPGATTAELAEVTARTAAEAGGRRRSAACRPRFAS